MRKLLAAAVAALLALSMAACGTSSPAPSAAPTPTGEVTSAPTAAEPAATTAATDAPTASATAAASPTPTVAPTDGGETPDSAGSGSLIFDIYKSWAVRDINFDGTSEDIRFTAGASKSELQIDGVSYDVSQPNLAQMFAVTDIDTTDKTMELVFTDAYSADLADSEKAYSWLYWWNGSKLIFMGGLMDVKFAGDWRGTFKASDVIDGNGQVSCLARTQELTDIWYTATYKVSGTARKLYEWRSTQKPIGDPVVLTCKTVCILFSDHSEVKRDDPTYMSSEYDYYWIPTLSPTTLGRILNPAEGIKIIAQPGDKLTIVGTYGPSWFKVKTQDGYTGWIYSKGGHVGGYYVSKAWTVSDMFDGLVSAG